MLTGNHLTMKRLRKEEESLAKEPIKNVIVKRQGNYDFHFLFYGLDGAYKDGYYHAVLQMHENYPFAAPKLKFFTPTGRMMVNTPICTTFTNYHPESWNAVWNIRTMIHASISFMTSNEGGYGVIHEDYEAKKKHAQDSLSKNLENKKFVKLFQSELLQRGIIQAQRLQHVKRNQQQNQKTVTTKNYKLAGMLIVAGVIALTSIALVKKFKIR